MRNFEWIIVDCKKYQCNGSFQKIGDVLIIFQANHLFKQLMNKRKNVSHVEFYNQNEMASYKGPYSVKWMTDSKVTLIKHNKLFIR